MDVSLHDRIGASSSVDAGAKPASTAREILCVFLPFLPTTRLIRQQGWPADTPVGLYHHTQQTDRLLFVSQTAQRAGLYPGLSVADARTYCISAQFHAVELDKDRACLLALAYWCRRYTPLVGIDETGCGLWLDLTGASHLFGGYDAVQTDIITKLSDAGLDVCSAIAPTYGAAWALAHYHDAASSGVIAPIQRAALSDCLSLLPVAALRLSAADEAILIQTGLRQIGDVFAMRRAALSMRLTANFLLRLDQLLGDVAEPLQPVIERQPVYVVQHWVEPLAGLEGLTQMVADLLAELSDKLMKKEQVARWFEIGWQRVDGSCARLHYHLSRPSNELALLMRLCTDAAEKIDAEFGLSCSWVQAYGLTDTVSVTALLGTDTQTVQAEKADQLLDILAAKFGPGKVQRLVPQDSWQAEQREQRATLAQAVDKHSPHLDWQVPSPAQMLAPRPVRLLDPPEPIQAMALLPDNPPVMIRWRHHSWKVMRATGPERIGPSWWQIDRQKTRSRDYYRIETNEGARLWIYREGLPERGEESAWYLHGFFA